MKAKKDMTLLQAIERVVELAEDSKMSSEFMKEAKTEIQLLAKSYGITERQAVLFCVCMEKGPSHVDYSDLASFLDLNKQTCECLINPVFIGVSAIFDFLFAAILRLFTQGPILFQ